MPRSVKSIVDDLNALLQERVRLGGGEPVMTIPWRRFYELCEITRFKTPRGEEIQTEGRERFGLIIAYGEKVVLVAHDRNFSPLNE
ncbi:hypothetical protein [Methylocystis parvus]|uniref:Uncharacterized protein n=1 Tax=Methylocystis parvus TaxID=134 RepID=A0A6B8M639_9HYPH|nr:hypothetical protein [Methylocystis parvus]QGM97928.1 hypothetical protein F7D14_10900 [Methylocystis parvus]WBK01760.1 hypothetical protein MMG94_08680 [Methylocystis parvus OBBP]